mgnify:CR=1 FL=1
MALTDTEIDDIAGPADYFDRRVFARAIEAGIEVVRDLVAEAAKVETEIADNIASMIVVDGLDEKELLRLVAAVQDNVCACGLEALRQRITNAL